MIFILFFRAQFLTQLTEIMDYQTNKAVVAAPAIHTTSIGSIAQICHLLSCKFISTNLYELTIHDINSRISGARE